MKHNTQPIVLIVGFYFLVLLVGGGQTIWDFFYSNSVNTYAHFYMFTRLALTVLILVSFLLSKKLVLYWSIVIESIINTFVISSAMYTIFYNLFQNYRLDNVKFYMEQYGYHIGWNSFLWLTSVTIIWYMITNWKSLIIQSEQTEKESV